MKMGKGVAIDSNSFRDRLVAGHPWPIRFALLKAHIYYICAIYSFIIIIRYSHLFRMARIILLYLPHRRETTVIYFR